MKNISKLKVIYKILIFLGTFASFVFAYFIYAPGMFNMADAAGNVAVIISLGIAAYFLFELIIILMHTLLKQGIRDFVITRSDFCYSFRIVIILRNICLGLINILFLYYPLISVWGILISYIIFTTLAVTGIYFVFKKNYPQQADSRIYLNRFVTFYSLFLVAYLIFGSLV